LWRLSWRDYLLLMRAAAVTIWIEFGLRRLGLPRLARQLGVNLDFSSAGQSVDDPAGPLPWQVRRAVWATDRIMRLMRVDATCLRRSLAVGRLVHEPGQRLRLGVVAGETGLAAHAWLVGESWTFSTDERSYQPLIASSARSVLR
jgi:hypothetical protein